jgi:hypothetical protein
MWCVWMIIQSTVSGQIKYLPLMEKEPESFSINMVVCNRTEQPPIVDGILDDEVWATAFKYEDFSNTIIHEKGKPWQKTTAWMVHDGRYLYFAFSCEEEEMDKIRSEIFRHDDPDILFDDRLEILLDPAHNHKDIIRLVVNADGITYDTWLKRPVQYAISYIKGDDRWNTEWRAKTRRYKDRWTCEVAIAIDRIYDGEIIPGTTWGFNIVRDRHAVFYYGPRGQKPAPSQEITAWQPVEGRVRSLLSDRYIEPNGYADLVFDQPVLSVSELQFHEAYANYNGSIWHKPQYFGDNPILISLQNHSEKNLNITIETTTHRPNGQVVSFMKDTTLPIQSVLDVATYIPIRGDDRQPFFLYIRDTDNNSLLYHTSYDTRVPPFVEFDLAAAYALEDAAGVTIKVAPVVVPGTLQDCRIKMALFIGDSDIPMCTDELRNMEEYEFVPCFPKLDPSSLGTGNYRIRNHLVNSEGFIMGTFDHLFTIHRKTPGGELSANETSYSFGGQEGKGVVVSFPGSDRFVFWEHASYVPWWDLNNMAVTYEFMESWGYGNQGCSEPMQDKENRYSRVDIIENTPARVVVLWRYALGDPNYQIIFNEWVHEYYYFYPDATGVREIRFWPNSDMEHEILQPQYVFPTGVIPEQMFEDTTCTVSNLEGDITVNLLDKPVYEHPEYARQWDEEIMRIYLKDRKHPYLVWSGREDIIPNAINKGLIKGDLRRAMGGHWPMQPMNVDVYSVVGTERPYHSWLGNLTVIPEPDKQPNRWIHLIGITDKDNRRLRQLAGNWLYPPEVNIKGKGFVYEGYNPVEKTHIFNQIGSQKALNFSFTGFDDSLVMPVLLIRNANTELKAISIGEINLEPTDFRTGQAGIDGAEGLIVWINREIDSGDHILIKLK